MVKIPLKNKEKLKRINYNSIDIEELTPPDPDRKIPAFSCPGHSADVSLKCAGPVTG